jgi:acetate kinase
MKILVINAGSSSVKLTLYNTPDNTALASGQVERIGLDGTRLHYANLRGDNVNRAITLEDTTAAIGELTSLLVEKRIGVIPSTRDISAIGHRVVHGGEKMTAPTLITEPVKKIILDCFKLAPLHNPPNMAGIRACEAHFPGVPQVAVFDTAFHTTLPDYAYVYGLPYPLYQEDKIRRYGFHGTSHQYVSQTAAASLNQPLAAIRLITCHLGNGCSITAVKEGRSIDTSMGFTPLEGLIMGTRCGDLDPAIVFYLMEHKRLDVEQINQLLNKQSGLLGLAGIGSNDLRDILNAKNEGHQQAELAVNAFIYRIKKYIGAYTAAMGGLDVIVFTAGIGENSAEVRHMVCAGLEGIGIRLDHQKNAAANGKCRQIQHDRSRVKIMVVPTDEERAIAAQTLDVIRSIRPAEPKPGSPQNGNDS